MKIRLILLLALLFTTLGTTQALDLSTPPAQLATSIQDVCDNNYDCIDFKKYILWDIFNTTESIDLKINLLFTIIYLT
jgi:hypothetical protein